MIRLVEWRRSLLTDDGDNGADDDCQLLTNERRMIVSSYHCRLDRWSSSSVIYDDLPSFSVGLLRLATITVKPQSKPMENGKLANARTEFWNLWINFNEIRLRW